MSCMQGDWYPQLHMKQYLWWFNLNLICSTGFVQTIGLDKWFHLVFQSASDGWQKTKHGTHATPVFLLAKEIYFKCMCHGQIQVLISHIEFGWRFMFFLPTKKPSDIYSYPSRLKKVGCVFFLFWWMICVAGIWNSIFQSIVVEFFVGWVLARIFEFGIFKSQEFGALLERNWISNIAG